MASDMYAIDVLAENIQDMQGNTTRFLVIGQKYSAPTGSDKTSIVFGVKHKVGALYDALSVFKTDNINMTKIESRPSKRKVWEYFFFIDIDGHVEDKRIIKALGLLADHTNFVKVLGSYPSAE